MRTNPHIIDVSDLPTSIERSEIQKYSFADDDFEVLVLFDLPEPISKDQVCPKWLCQAPVLTLCTLVYACRRKDLLCLEAACPFVHVQVNLLFAILAAANLWWRVLFCV